MATDGRLDAIIDTSVLLNFLRIDRIDLLAKHPEFRFVVVDLVRNEVTKRGQAERLEAALQKEDLIPDGSPETISTAELATFAALSAIKIGNGDRAVIAAAKVRGLALAMDDDKAWRRASAFCVGIPRVDTVSIVVSLIRAGILTLGEADAFKVDWATKYSFAKPKFASFSELS